MNPFNGGWLILVTLFLAMVLSVAHLPETWPGWIGWLRPNWVLLVLFFWVMELPHRIGLIAVWILGFGLDALLGQPLGLNGFIFAAFTYVTWRFFERLRMYSIVQQCGVLWLMTSLAELIRLLVGGIGSEQVFSWGFLTVGVVTMLLWPLVFLVMLRIRGMVRVE